MVGRWWEVCAVHSAVQGVTPRLPKGQYFHALILDLKGFRYALDKTEAGVTIQGCNPCAQEAEAEGLASSRVGWAT